MVDLIGLVNPGYQKAVDAAGKPAPAAAAEETEEVKDSAAAGQETQKPDVDTFESGEKEEAKTPDDSTGKIYKPNQKLVAQLKAEQAQIQARFINSVKDMLSKQGVKVAWAEGSDNNDAFWQTIAKGDYTVDPEIKSAAQEAISEDGYWGVKQTSQRIVDFGKALVGGNPEKIGLLKDAFIKGFEAATKSWGGALPDITKDTYDAVMDLFDKWEKGDEGGDAPADKPSAGVSGNVVSSSVSVFASISVSATITTTTITDD